MRRSLASIAVCGLGATVVFRIWTCRFLKGEWCLLYGAAYLAVAVAMLLLLEALGSQWHVPEPRNSLKRHVLAGLLSGYFAGIFGYLVMAAWGSEWDVFVASIIRPPVGEHILILLGQPLFLGTWLPTLGGMLASYSISLRRGMRTSVKSTTEAG